MTVKQIIEAARNENAVEFEKNFNRVVNEKLGISFDELRKKIISEQFNLQDDSLSDEETMFIEDVISHLSESEIEELQEMDDNQIFELFVGLAESEDSNRKSFKRGAVSGAVRGAVGGAISGGVRHVADRLIHRGASKVARGVKKIVKRG